MRSGSYRPLQRIFMEAGEQIYMEAHQLLNSQHFIEMRLAGFVGLVSCFYNNTENVLAFVIP